MVSESQTRHTLTPINEERAMGITYEVLSWEYRYCHYGQAPSCATVAEAVRWLGPADFVVAVEDGVMRQLTAD